MPPREDPQQSPHTTGRADETPAAQLGPSSRWLTSSQINVAGHGLDESRRGKRRENRRDVQPARSEGEFHHLTSTEEKERRQRHAGNRYLLQYSNVALSKTAFVVVQPAERGDGDRREAEW
jgi:hypothetical protein